MFFMQANPSQRVPGTELIQTTFTNPVIPGCVRTPETLEAARQLFAAYTAEAEATGKGAYVRAFWQSAGKLGGPKRAPKGLKQAEAQGEFRAHVNV